MDGVRSVDIYGVVRLTMFVSANNKFRIGIILDEYF